MENKDRWSKEEVDLASEEEEFIEGEEGIFPCKYCNFITDDEDRLDEHIVTHDEVFEDEEENYHLENSLKPRNKSPDSCNKQQTTYEKSTNKDQKRMYICPFCDYQSMKKLDMGKHIDEHTNKLEIYTYACSECSYVTKRKCDMPKHLLSHCDSSYVQIYKCPVCIYTSKRKGDLAKHMLCHNSESAAEIYQCSQCLYFSCRSGDFKRHMLCHDHAFKASPFNCTECGYTSKRLNDLHKHAVLHCDRAIRGLFKCTKCDYASLEGNPFAKHVLSNCQSRKDYLGEYVIVEDNKEMRVYQCGNEENFETGEQGKKRKIVDADTERELKHVRENREHESKVVVLTGFDGNEKNVNK